MHWSSVQRQKLKTLREQITKKEQIQLLLQCNIMVENNTSSEGSPVKVISPDTKLESLHHPLAPSAKSLLLHRSKITYYFILSITERFADGEGTELNTKVHHIVAECMKLVALKIQIPLEQLKNLLPNDILSSTPTEFFMTYIQVLKAVDAALENIRLVWEDKALFARRVQNALVEADNVANSTHRQSLFIYVHNMYISRSLCV